jgi:hypothetical protein
MDGRVLLRDDATSKPRSRIPFEVPFRFNDDIEIDLRQEYIEECAVLVPRLSVRDHW